MSRRSSINFESYRGSKRTVTVFDRVSESFRNVAPSAAKKSRYAKVPSRGPARQVPFWRSMGLGGSIADAQDFRIRQLIGKTSRRK